MVRVENVVAIFMASNVTTTCHIKHVDIRCKNVNQHVEDGVAKIVLVKSADNGSNTLNKNLSVGLH